VEIDVMNQMNFADRQAYDQMGGQMAPPAQLGQPGLVTLKRVGARPLSFNGTELCMAMSFVPGAPFWYEVNVYRTDAQGFVVAIKQFFRDENETDFVRAWEFEDFDGAMAHLEAYDPADDIRVDIDPSAEMTLPELAAHALALRARAAEARRQFKALVGEILFDLEQAG
jgi:hypothetical protein